MQSELLETNSSDSGITESKPVEFPKSQVLDLLSRRDVHDLMVVAEVGSIAHGISVGGSDFDYTVLRFESWTEFVNGPGDRQSMQVRTQPDGIRSRLGDIDLSVYTVRKFAHLAMAGNPSILSVLWSPNTYLARDLWPHFCTSMQGYVPAVSAGQAFLGYMRQQMERWAGTRGQKNVTRPELVAQYGFDVKYAAQIIKLGHQGIRFMEAGIIEIPIEEPLATEIKSLRTGGCTEAQALDWAKAIEARLKHAINKSSLPERPNQLGIQHLVASTYGQHYAAALR
jgi:hypothetical protein